MAEVHEHDESNHEEHTTSGLFETVVLRSLGPIDEMEDVDEYERLIPDEKGKKNGRELTSSLGSDDGSNGNYDEALEAAGIGKFTWLLAILCGWANASESIEIVCVSFILPSAEKELNLSSTDKGLLNSIIFIGMLVGSFTWGSLADIQGRRKVFIYSLSVNALFGILSSFAQVFWVFLLLRFISGVGVGGSVAIFSYFAEFQQRERRGMMISIVATFWLAGTALTAGLAWAIIPSNLGFHEDGERFSYESWRVFIAFCTIPSLTSIVSFIFLPESPKFLLETGRAEEALEVLRKMFVWNNMGAKSDYPIAVLLPMSKSKAQHIDNADNLGVSRCTRIYIKFARVGRAVGRLFKPPLTRVTISMNAIIFALSFGFYGLWMWFPQLFEEAESQGAVCEKSWQNSSIPVKNSTDGTDNSIYTDSFYTAISNLPGNLISIFLMDVIGRKALLCSSLILSGVGVFFIYLVKTRTQVLIMSCIFSGISVMSWNSVSVLGVEMYPTTVRCTATGLQSVSNRIGAILGNLIFGVFIDINCAIPIIAVAAMLAIGGLITLTLPNTVKISLK